MKMFGDSFLRRRRQSGYTLFIHRVIYLQIELIRIYYIHIHTTMVYLNHVRNGITYSLVELVYGSYPPTPRIVSYTIYYYTLRIPRGGYYNLIVMKLRVPMQIDHIILLCVYSAGINRYNGYNGCRRHTAVQIDDD